MRPVPKVTPARGSAAVRLVILCLVVASLACYSGQIPGVFELTPYATLAPLPTPAVSRLAVGDQAYTPAEPGRSFFYLSLYPEPLANNLANSKALCNANAAARVLYAAQDASGDIYYLLNCEGSAGWAAEQRLAGPVHYQRGDLALAVAAPGQPKVTLLDELTLQPAPIFAQQCAAETIVPVLGIKVAAQGADSLGSLYYLIECPRGTRGYVEASQLAGPLEIDVGERALAVTGGSLPGQPFPLASEPGPLAASNAVEGACVVGDVLTAEQARLVDNQVFYRLTCGSASGWASSERIVGPLWFDPGMNAMIQVAPIASADAGAEAPASDSEAEVLAPAATPASGPEIAYAVPPAFLAASAGPAVFGAEDGPGNITGACPDRAVAAIHRYAGGEGHIYYEVTCPGCPAQEVQTETQNILIDGAAHTATVSICPETHPITGWIDQQLLRGPLPFAPGDTVQIKASSATREAAEDGTGFVRLPATTSGAFALTPSSQHVQFAGRCPADTAFTVVDFATEPSRTGSGLLFYYKVACTGQPALPVQVDQGSAARAAGARYDETASSTITGWLLARDLERAAP